MTSRYEVHISPGGGGSNQNDMPIVLNRRNLSVNGGVVDNWDRTTPSMLTNGSVNNAGAFNGASIANKAILGSFRADLTTLLLKQVVGLGYTIEQLTPEAGLSLATVPYVNLIVELDPDGAPGVLSILAMGRYGSKLKDGVFSSPAKNQLMFLWTPASNVYVVSDKGVGAITPAEGPPPPPSSAWASRTYRVSDILVAYPKARVVNGDTGDADMPKGTITPALMMCLDDGGLLTRNAVRVLSFQINGVEV